MECSFRPLHEICDDMMAELKAGTLCHCTFSHAPRGDSVLEDRFWHLLRKTQDGWHGTADQFWIGNYRVDALIDCNGQAVVIELDGKAFHNPAKDYDRDTEILKSVNAIIRIPYAALWYYESATFQILSQWFHRLYIRRANLAITEEQLYEEFHGCDNPSSEYYASDHTPESWVEFMDANYSIYRYSHDGGVVGSATQFLHGSRAHPIQIRRGTLDPSILDRLYTQTNCLRLPGRYPMMEVN